MATAPPLDLDECLKPFGLESFRPGQREVIETVLAGQDCLCVMPTGGGKSLCYQLPAIARSGVTLVVSPLIALMKDQVDQLMALGLRATCINSAITPDEQLYRLERMAAGEYSLVYVAPERFRSPRMIEAAGRTHVQLLAVDEAHCISEWGHDFRPDYARLGQFRSRLGNPATIALTATATDAVRRDIVAQLGLREPKTFITGFARPNLFFEVQWLSAAREKDERLVRFLAENPGSGIVYASSRKRCEGVAQMIAERSGRRTGVYHAGMPSDDRRAAQEAFMTGRTEIVVATLAFGMGIDKADVRFVVHYNVPGSIEAYYQEAGRAGRDGELARCLLMLSGGDRYIHEFFIESAYPARDVVERVYKFLMGLDENPIELTLQEIKDSLGLQISSEGVGTCEKLLDKAGVIERLEAVENKAAVRIGSELPTLVDLLPQSAKVKRRVLQAVESLVRQQRGDWVYFHPRELLARAELDSNAVSRSLRELTELEAFDYVPPFRGRAIHVRERGRPFDSLQIDFEALQLRKDAEYEKLERMLDYGRSRSCRQQEILRYFGERTSGPCRHCDMCGPAASAAATQRGTQPVDEAILTAARVVLSGVARAPGRCGKQLLAQMLCGSGDKKVARNRLDRLSTFGLLKQLKQSEVVQLIDSLLATGHIEQTEIDRFRPVLDLTPQGSAVMSGRARPASLPLPTGLFERLRHLKLQQTAAPPAPGAVAAPAVDDYREPIGSPVNGPASDEAAADDAAATPLGEQPSHYWTWRLLKAGFLPKECMAARGLSREAVLDHALRAARGGMAVRSEWFLSPALESQLRKLIGSDPSPRVRSLLAQLPAGTRYEDVQWFLECRRTGALRGG